MARILIVDDEEMDRVFLNEVLGSAGHDLFFAREGQSALGAYKEHEIDVVVTDLAMPQLDGIALIEEVLQFDPGACFVAISGAVPPRLEEARQAGALSTLEKPIDPRDLVEAVAEAERERERRADPWG